MIFLHEKGLLTARSFLKKSLKEQRSQLLHGQNAAIRLCCISTRHDIIHLLQTLDAYILLESPYPVGKEVVAVRQQAQMVAKTGPKSWRPVPLSEVKRGLDSLSLLPAILCNSDCFRSHAIIEYSWACRCISTTLCPIQGKLTHFHQCVV